MTTLPALSTPWTWNTFLARSTPSLHLDDPSCDSLFNNHPMAHSMPGAGVVHQHHGNRFRPVGTMSGIPLTAEARAGDAGGREGQEHSDAPSQALNARLIALMRAGGVVGR